MTNDSCLTTYHLAVNFTDSKPSVVSVVLFIVQLVYTENDELLDNP